MLTKAGSGIKRMAAEIVKRRFRVFSIAQAAYRKLQENDEKRIFKRVKDDAHTLLRMAKAWSDRQYTHMPWRVLLYTLGGLLYFLNPIDVIPDFLFGIGFVDDVAVLGAVAGALEKEIHRFEEWEQAR